MRTAQDSGADQGLALTLEFGPSTSARLGVTIFSGNEVTVALKYALSDRSGGSILTEGTVEGKGSVPTGGEALIAPLPAAYIMTQDAFAGASQQAMTTALSTLRAQLVKHGVCQAS